MSDNLENSAVATGLAKVSFHFNPKERQCQRMLKLPHNCTHLTRVRMAVIKKFTKNKCWRGVEKRESFYSVGRNANWYSHCGEQCGDSFKNWKQNCRTTQQSYCWAYTSRKPELKEKHEPQCSLQHCLQQLGHGSNPDVHPQMNG